MSNDWDYDDNDQATAGSKLRAQLEKALADKKAAEQERDEARARLTERTGVEVLTAKGYKPAVARLAIKDGVDVSDEKALETWLTDNGDLFAKSDANPSSQDDAPSSNQQQQQTPPPPGVASVFGALNNIHAAASPALVSEFDRVMSSLKDDASPEEVLAALRGR